MTRSDEDTWDLGPAWGPPRRWSPWHVRWPDAGARIGASSARMSEEWRRHGLDLDMADLFYDGERNPVVDYLRERGWDVTARSRPDMSAQYGRPFPTGEEVEALRQSLSVTATKS